MTPKTPCPRCGLPVGPHHRARHMRACERMPLPDEMARQAETMTAAEMARAWNSNPATVTSRLRFLGIRPLKYGQSALPETVARMMALYDEGVPVYEIAAMIGVGETKTQRTILRLLAEGKLTKREKPFTVPATYTRCKVCGIRLDGPGVPDGDDGRCGFCAAGDPGREVMEAGGAEKLAEDVLAVAVGDATSANGYRAAARWWLANEASSYWFDVLCVDRGFVRERMAAEGAL